jgi:drug/metabolite transporter (DMT)-like permease
MLMLCLSWGFNQIAVKLVLPDVPPMLQALIRSYRRVAGAAHHRLAARRQILRARRHAVAPGCLRASSSASNSC